MSQSIGQIIKKLRKERNLTQEELAEQLNVTSQAVSKWENETGLPDITQIVPLANIFGVSADVLLGIVDANAHAEVIKIFDEAQAQISRPLSREGLKKKYQVLQKGLKTYPNNMILLMQSLETGISLAYPETEYYDSQNGEAIYHECIRQSNLIITYSQATTDVLRAHMIMVMLHSAYGNFKDAELHAEKFPRSGRYEY